MNVPGRQQRRDHAESISLLMSKLMAVRPTRKASNTGGKFSENAWERAARTWTRQKTIWSRRAKVRWHWREGGDENRSLLSDNC